MGQQQSAEKSASSRIGTPQPEKEKKINRRVSIQALSHGRATPADPSASKDNAVAQTTPQHLEKPALQQYLQSASSDYPTKGVKIPERSTSRASSNSKKHEVQQRPERQALQQQPPVSVPQSSSPMDVPTSKMKAEGSNSRGTQDDFDEKRFEEKAGSYHDRRYTPVAQLRPPRLPLPIADVSIPESPTLAPIDKGNADVPLFEADEPLSSADADLQRRGSVLSSTTPSEEDVGDELQPYAVDTASQLVPTVIEWKGPGNKVYVTGTFANWEKKYRLHQRKSSPGMFTTINLPPGTHHLKFVVDGEMLTSEDLPTAVDFNNFLVNYVEIATEHHPVKSRRGSHLTGAKSVVHPAHPTLAPPEQEASRSGDASPEDSDVELQAEEIPAGDFRQIIPQALLDIDLPDEDPRYHQAARIISDGVGPPSLPLFLSRSILNGSLPVKDDNSVLTLPNHTVLNHLMTSSVKNGVLATSVTTRYKKKYVTTISFKPVPRFQSSYT